MVLIRWQSSLVFDMESIEFDSFVMKIKVSTQSRCKMAKHKKHCWVWVFTFCTHSLVWARLCWSVLLTVLKYWDSSVLEETYLVHSIFLLQESNKTTLVKKSGYYKYHFLKQHGTVYLFLFLWRLLFMIITLFSLPPCFYSSLPVIWSMFWVVVGTSIQIQTFFF